MEQIEQILEQFRNVCNKSKAKKYLDELKQQDSSKLADMLISGLRLQQQELAELSADLFRKCFLESEQDMDRLDGQKLVGIVETIKTVMKESSIEMQKKLCENMILIYKQQKEHQKTLQIAYEFYQADMKVASLYIVELFCDYNFDEQVLKNLQTQIIKMFEVSLEDEDLNVRLQASVCISAFLNFVQDQELVLKFQSIVPLGFEILVEAIQKDEEQGLRILESMTSLVEMHPKLVKTQFDQFANLLIELFKNNKSGDSLRKTALSNLLEIGTEFSSQMKKSEIVGQKMFIALFQILQESEEQEEDMEQWLAEIEDTSSSKDDLQKYCQDIMTKMTLELGCKFMIKNSIGIITKLLQSSSDKQIYAGLLGLSYMLDKASEHYKDDLDSFMVLIKPHLKNKELNVRVKYALMTLLAMLCTEFSPNIQNDYHEMIVGFIIQNMGHDELKIQHKNTQCLANFVKDLVDNENSEVDLQNYSEQILNHIKRLFQNSLENNQLKMLEEVLSCLGFYSLAIESDFSKYYQDFMPNLKQLILKFPSGTVQQVNIRVLTIECIGQLLKSVKDSKETFINDVDQIMTSLIKLQESVQSNADQHLLVITNVYSNMAEILRKEFKQYLERVYPSVLKNASIDIDFYIEDMLCNHNHSIDEECKSKTSCQLNKYGTAKQLAMNAAAGELKVGSIECIASICNNLRDALDIHDYIDKTFKQACLMLECKKTSREVKYKTLDVLVAILDCVPVQRQKGIIQDSYDLMIRLLNKQVKTYRASEVDTIMTALAEMLKKYKTVDRSLLTQEQIQQTIELIKQSLEASQKAKNKILKKYDEYKTLDQLDEDDYEEFEYEYEYQNDVFSCNVDMAGQLLRIFQSDVESTYLQQICPFYSEIVARLNNKSSDNELLYAVCMVNDLFEFGSQGTIEQMGNQMMKQLITIFDARNNQDIRQSVVYGYGLYAEKQTLDSSVLKVVLQHMNTAFKSFAKNDDDEAKETAVVAMFKTSLSQQLDQQMDSKIAGLLMDCIPFQSEGDEIRQAHTLFLRQVRDGNPSYKDRVDKVQEIYQSLQKLEAEGKENDIVDEEGLGIIKAVLDL